MDGGKRNRIIIVATIAATVLLVAAGIASALLNPIPSSTGDPTRLVAASKSKERSAAAGRSGHASTRASALKLCSDIAPKAAKAYVTDSENRESELRKYFTTDAQARLTARTRSSATNRRKNNEKEQQREQGKRRADTATQRQTDAKAAVVHGQRPLMASMDGPDRRAPPRLAGPARMVRGHPRRGDWS